MSPGKILQNTGIINQNQAFGQADAIKCLEPDAHSFFSMFYLLLLIVSEPTRQPSSFCFSLTAMETLAIPTTPQSCPTFAWCVERATGWSDTMWFPRTSGMLECECWAFALVECFFFFAWCQLALRIEKLYRHEAKVQANR